VRRYQLSFELGSKLIRWNILGSLCWRHASPFVGGDCFDSRN
jgi:hypothetical protein